MTPTETLRRYLDASAAYDFTTCWHLLCAEEQRARPLQKYLQVMEALPRGGVPSRTYEEEWIDRDRASVRVVWMSPDPAGMRALGAQVRDGVITPEEYSRRLRAGDIPRRPRPEVYELRLEAEEWRVVGQAKPGGHLPVRIEITDRRLS